MRRIAVLDDAPAQKSDSIGQPFVLARQPLIFLEK
jgi:hypothetical protein